MSRRFTMSKDGIPRCTIRVEIRLTKPEYNMLAELASFNEKSPSEMAARIERSSGQVKYYLSNMLECIDVADANGLSRDEALDCGSTNYHGCDMCPFVSSG